MAAGSDGAGTARDRVRGIVRDDDRPSVALVLLAGGVAAAEIGRAHV